MAYEKKDSPLLPRKTFYRRLLRSFMLSSSLLFLSLVIGVVGYHLFASLGWIDSLLNASMILTGMGPVDKMTTDGGKLFASFYALFSGIAFLTMMGIVIAPVLHRFLHKFHIGFDEK